MRRAQPKRRKYTCDNAHADFFVCACKVFLASVLLLIISIQPLTPIFAYASELDEAEGKLDAIEETPSEFLEFSHATEFDTDHHTTPIIQSSGHEQTPTPYPSVTQTASEVPSNDVHSESYSSTSSTVSVLGTETIHSETIGSENVNHNELIMHAALNDGNLATYTDLLSTTSETIGNELSTTVVLRTHHQNDHTLLFSKRDCVLVTNNTYTCIMPDSDGTPPSTPVVFAQSPDGEDNEIFLQTETHAIQITDNSFDDTNPVYDSVSNSVVWHSLIEGRYVVFVYDIATQSTRSVSDESVNSIHPTRYGGLIAWQGWVHNNWEIFTEEHGVIQQLTSSEAHDISPQVSNEYILWQTVGNGTRHISLYERSSGTVIPIIDDAIGMAQNPRLLVVYDSIQNNGDIITKGYDIVSKTVVPLSALPRSIPPTVPDPEQTGEERALLQQSISYKPKQSNPSLGDYGGDSEEPQTEPHMVNDAYHNADIIVTPYEPSHEPPIQTDFDLVIPEIHVMTSTDAALSPTIQNLEEETNSIVLVIPPYEPEVQSRTHTE